MKWIRTRACTGDVKDVGESTGGCGAPVEHEQCGARIHPGKNEGKRNPDYGERDGETSRRLKDWGLTHCFASRSECQGKASYNGHDRSGSSSLDQRAEDILAASVVSLGELPEQEGRYQDGASHRRYKGQTGANVSRAETLPMTDSQHEDKPHRVIVDVQRQRHQNPASKNSGRLRASGLVSVRVRRRKRTAPRRVISSSAKTKWCLDLRKVSNLVSPSTAVHTHICQYRPIIKN